VVVDPATSDVILECDLTHAGRSKWSPDSGSIAVSGLAYKDWDGALLYTVTVPDGRVAVIDSLGIRGTHEFSWSPDSRWIAFSRPTELHHHGDTIAAGLWIADATSSESWCVLDAQEWAEADPLWTSNRSLQITRVQWKDDGPNLTQRLVVELSHAAEAKR
jgi:Tol biopolymer transport system component